VNFPAKFDSQVITLKRILNNFVSNSIKHCTFKTITVQLKTYKNSKELNSEYPHFTTNIGYDTNKSLIAFVVEDTGSGLSPEKLLEISQQRVKTDNEITNYDGTGVGLNIVLNYIKTIPKAGILYNSVKNSSKG